MLYRMVRSARIDGAIYRSLREDGKATGQSILALAIAGLSLGLGYAASFGLDTYGLLSAGAIGVVLGLVVGFLWLSLTFLIITRLFKGTTSFWGLGRPLFFASSPALIFLLMLIPGLSFATIVAEIGLAWIALANVFAIKNAMGFDNQRSFATFVIAAFVLLIAYGLFTSV